MLIRHLRIFFGEVSLEILCLVFIFVVLFFALFIIELWDFFIPDTSPLWGMCFTNIFPHYVTYFSSSGIPIICMLGHLVFSHCSWILCFLSFTFSFLHVLFCIIDVHLSSSLLILPLVVSFLVISPTKEWISDVLFCLVLALPFNFFFVGSISLLQSTSVHACCTLFQ